MEIKSGTFGNGTKYQEETENQSLKFQKKIVLMVG
jgi:hypothetical protein